MKTLRIAIPSIGTKGMKDKVSSVFAKAPVFTIIDIVEGEIKEIRKEKNPASDLKQGSGPIVVKNLKDQGVEIIVSGEIGPGARTLIEMSGIKLVNVEPNIRVSEALEIALKKLSSVKTGNKSSFSLKF
ncbi:NifB/NifX family molybdenum-iron cluster-binding protein [Candidatus Bathyarchaeota archaeon]|nr:NifB/NifX family molybdenum-iron cluster-binding protein [Candidatus Bathyarchaeota archaeon]